MPAAGRKQDRPTLIAADSACVNCQRAQVPQTTAVTHCGVVADRAFVDNHSAFVEDTSAVVERAITVRTVLLIAKWP